MKVVLPLSVNSDPAIVDGNNKVLIPLCWKNDTEHVIRQTKIGEYICDIVNKHNSIYSK